MVILRTDAGQVIGKFRTTRLAQAYAMSDASLHGIALAITSMDGVVLLRWHRAR